MPPRKQVPSLFQCSGQILTDILHSLCTKFMEDLISFDDFAECTEMLQLELRNILVHSQPEIAQLWLKTANEMVCHYTPKSYWERKILKHTMLKLQFVAQSLVRVASRLNLQKFVRENWSELVYSNVFNNLWRMNGLKHLDCGGIWRGPMCHKILYRLPFLTNLTYLCFEGANDGTIVMLCKNCPSIKSLILKECPDVTEKSLENIATLKKLEEIYINGTNITEKGRVKLLLTSQSETLADILGYGHLGGVDIEYFLEHLVADVVPFRTFNLRSLYWEDANSSLLPLFPKYFPLLNKVHFFNFFEGVPELSSLNSLEHLNLVNLQITDTDKSYLYKLLSLRSPVLTKLYLDFDYATSEEIGELEIDIHSFLDFGLHCPNLQFINLYNCIFTNDFGTIHVSRNPFPKLKVFSFHSISVFGVDIILSNAINIEKICLSPSELAIDVVTDDFLTGILLQNPLRKLESFCYADNVSVEMLKQLVTDCPNISSLSCTSCHPANSASNIEKLNELQRFITQNNYDVNVNFPLKPR